jgi:hypothetical protein
LIPLHFILKAVFECSVLRLAPLASSTVLDMESC